MSASIALSIRVGHRNLSTGSKRVVALPQGFFELSLDAKRMLSVAGRCFPPAFPRICINAKPPSCFDFSGISSRFEQINEADPFNDRDTKRGPFPAQFPQHFMCSTISICACKSGII